MSKSSSVAPAAAPAAAPAVSSAFSPAWVWIGVFALAKLTVQLFAFRGYGYFRDELYYLSCTDHLAWGYVDQPPLSIAVLWLVKSLFGEGLFALRIVPALAGAGVVAVVGWMASRMGGGRGAQALAMTATLVAPVYLSLSHFYSMNALGLLFWALSSALIVHLVDDGDRRWWPVLGVVLGLGLLNKIDVLWLGAGLGVGLLIAGRRHLATSGPWLAGGLSILILAPHVLWQIANDWPTVEFVKNASAQKMQSVAPLDYLFEQVMMMSPLTLPVWFGGLVFLWLLPAGRRFRVAGWIYPTVLVILLLNSTSRAGYLAGAYPLLFAAGGVALAALFGAASQRRRSVGLVVGFAYGLLLMTTGAFLAPLGLPILNVETYIDYAARLGQQPSTDEKKEVGPLKQFYADMFGWPELAAEMARVVDQLDDKERQQAAIFVGNYGEAGALRHFGRQYGLPPVLSGHNSHWMWGPKILEENGIDGQVMIVLGSSEERLRGQFADVELAGRTACTYCMPYENGVPIWIARKPLGDIVEAWPRFKHFD